MDLDAVANHEFLIKPDFDETLQELKVRLDQVVEQIPEEQYRVSKDLGLELDKKLKLEKNTQHGYFFRVTRTVRFFTICHNMSFAQIAEICQLHDHQYLIF